MELTCYNKGCGKTYIEAENKEDSCVYHPGVPVFHDAYKGWSCCSKKCTDFTEFLNFKGCAVSKHSNVKPVEPPKPTPVDISTEEEQTKAPAPKKSLPRPPIDSPMTLLTPTLAASVASRVAPPPAEPTIADAGTICKRGGCRKEFPDAGPCDHHPGYPVFHEGMKFWSCCNRKTADFDAFMEQAGCVRGTHLWQSAPPPSCRIDWHQTGTHVVVSLFSKSYLPSESQVSLSPVRLSLTLGFPQGAVQRMDIHLNGLVSVSESRVDMFGTKVEVKLRKAEPGSWSKLGADLLPKPAETDSKDDDIVSNAVALEAIDLSDL